MGDFLLLFAVPAGIGKEIGSLKPAVLMWLVPAIAVYFSTFLAQRIQNRETSARRDYAFVLIGLAALELCFAIMTIRFRNQASTVALVTCFVFLYAFAKEGIPRLLYVVAQYRYFVSAADYSRIAGKSQALNILAGLLGTAVAGILLTNSNWRLALLFDAVTFLVLGLTLLLFGKDPELSDRPVQAPTNVTDKHDRSVASDLVLPLSLIYLGVGILVSTGSIVWNYVPLLSEQFRLMNAGQSVLIIGLFRLPGVLAGLVLTKITSKIAPLRLVKNLPWLYLFSSVSFLLVPFNLTLVLLALIQGLLMGVYWPVDYSFRNRLPHQELVRFNTRVLRRLAVLQFIGCIAVLVIDEFGLQFRNWATFIVLSLVITVTILDKIRNRVAACLTGLLICFLSTGCVPSPLEKAIHVVLPSVSKNLSLRPELTYAGLSIINDTSAHLVTLSQDLTLRPVVLSRYEVSSDGTEYSIELDNNYSSVRGETIDAEDFLFTIRYYLVEKPALAGPYFDLVGADKCKTRNCPLKGFSIQSSKQVRIRLRAPDFRYIERLASPWLVLLKKGRPEVESAGSCLTPYQTGGAYLVQCDERGILLRFKDGKEALVTQSARHLDLSKAHRIVSENPGKIPSPSLTILAIFANPSSTLLTKRQRQGWFDSLRSGAETLSSELNLRWSPMMTPQWLGVSVPSDLKQISQPRHMSCGSRPARILLDTSLPDLEKLKQFIRGRVKCPVEFEVTSADMYFDRFRKNDLGIAWFTPDFLDLYNQFSFFDCSEGGSCYFDWHDKKLQSTIDDLRKSCKNGHPNKDTAIQIEMQIFRNSYAVPLAEMNWWMVGPSGARSIHSAGLAQLRISDFLSF
jgi:hypothetical protein